MIENDAQLGQALEVMCMMYRALADLRKDILPRSRQWFNLMAQGPVDEIRKMRAEIDAYTGMNKVVSDDEDSPESAGAEIQAKVGSFGSRSFENGHGVRPGSSPWTRRFATNSGRS